MERTRLKGGSLSGTYLIQEGDEAFVRKEVSLTINREYGYQRWYSQLKRLQRYSVLFPGLFPAILRYGSSGDMAWFDMPYIANAVTGHEFILAAQSKEQVSQFFEQLITKFNLMHRERIPSSTQALRLYFQEEVERALSVCAADENFSQFQHYKTIIFNGSEVKPLAPRIDRMIELAMRNYLDPCETFTHGNSTLENMLYVADSKELYFIDPYEETIVDSALGEYSQVLQSSNSYYELYNSLPVKVENNAVTFDIERSTNLDYFNSTLLEYLHSHYSNEQVIVTRILEISQFIRMLPFKLSVAPDKLIFFYSLASALFQKLEEDISA